MINEYEEKTKHPAGGWSALILLILLLLAGIAGAIIGFVLSDDYPALVALSVVWMRMALTGVFSTWRVVVSPFSTSK